MPFTSDTLTAPMKEGAAKALGFSGGETATPRLLHNQRQKPQSASTFHRCPEEFYAEPTQINHPLRTSPQTVFRTFFTFRELSHIITPWLLFPLFSGFQESSLPDVIGQEY